MKRFDIFSCCVGIVGTLCVRPAVRWYWYATAPKSPIAIVAGVQSTGDIGGGTFFYSTNVFKIKTGSGVWMKSDAYVKGIEDGIMTLKEIEAENSQRSNYWSTKEMTDLMWKRLGVERKK